MELEYNNGNILNSIYYQVRCLYQEAQERFYSKDSIPATVPVDTLISQMNQEEKQIVKR